MHIIYDFLETFFPLWSGRPNDPTRHIMCIWCLSKSVYFVQVYLKSRCHISRTSSEWTTHSTMKAETWSNNLLDRMEEFTKLSEFERESNKKKSKMEPPIDIDLGGKIFFDAF